MTDDDIAIFELAASLCTGYLKPEVPHNYSFNDDDLLAFARGIEARVLEELRKQEPTPKGFIVVSKDLLVEAIACNTDASLADARHIINSVLKVSDDGIFREALKELEQ